MRTQIRFLQNLDIPAKASQQLSSCSIAVQQMVAIARAVDMDCKVLILDEPTSSLDEQEVDKAFRPDARSEGQRRGYHLRNPFPGSGI